MNIKDFHPLREVRVLGKPVLSLTPASKNISLNNDVARFFKRLNITKVQLLCNSDRTALAVAESVDGSGATLSESRLAFSHRAVGTMLREKFNLTEKDGVRFVGEYDEENKVVFFELDNPIYI